MQETAYVPIGRNAGELLEHIEDEVLTGALRPGTVLPSVRALAAELDLSPTTVAKAYRELRRRGVVVTRDRSRTVIAHRPPLRLRLAPVVPDGTVDLATGNPDPDLLPSLEAAIRSLPTVQHRYTDDVLLPELLAVATDALTEDGLDAEHLLVVGGGLDGIERVLEVYLRLGDRVAVEDPGYPGSLDLVRTLGLEPVSVEVDDQGPVPASLEQALQGGVAALLIVPRAQNPTGAAITSQRAAELRSLLDAYPEVLVIEDDHAAPIAQAPLVSLTRGRTRWAVVRSVAKWLGPQLRVAVLVGDEGTTTRVLARQRLGTGWVSQLLQHVVAATWQQARSEQTLTRVADLYDTRRRALTTALADHGITAWGPTGLNLWIEVEEEVPVVQGLAARGWAVAAGEAFRLRSPAGIRITTATLAEADAPRLAADLAAVLDRHVSGRRG